MVREDEIEDKQARANELARVVVTMTQIFAVGQSVDGPGRKMIHASNVLVLTPGGVAALFEFVRERLRSFLRVRAKLVKLPRHEEAGVGRNDIQETRLQIGVAEALECGGMFLSDFHRERMSVAIPRAPRTPRSRFASPRGVYKENPARALSAAARPP